MTTYSQESVFQLSIHFNKINGNGLSGKKKNEALNNAIIKLDLVSPIKLDRIYM